LLLTVSILEVAAGGALADARYQDTADDKRADGLKAECAGNVLAAMRVAPSIDTTAFDLRHRGFSYRIFVAWKAADQSAPAIEWARSFAASLQPFSGGRIYLNYITDEGEAGVRAAYAGNYQRLAALKNNYDPTNFFRMNQNIKPTV